MRVGVGAAARLGYADEAEHLDACHLDEETKAREAAKLVETMMAEEMV